MTAYYNEIDPYAAQWLRNLISAGHIAPGDVDERSITEVMPDDIKGYTQCHFFAGIGGWSIALRLAGWEDEKSVWTGSCPCQPFSVAGKAQGQKDERHLWPHWFRLIATILPSAVFGEQVAGAIAHGWLDDAFDDLEREGYETGAAVLPACSVGAPHKRDRLWFFAHTMRSGEYAGAERTRWKARSNIGGRCASTIVGNTSKSACEWNTGAISRTQEEKCSEGKQHGNFTERFEYAGASSGEGLVADPKKQSERKQTDKTIAVAIGRKAWHESSNGGEYPSNTNSEQEKWATISRGECDFWRSEPAVGRVANGIPARAHKLRAYGNAIVPQVAAEFIKAFMECQNGPA